MNAIAKEIKDYLEHSRELHRQLNSPGFPDVDTEYEKLREKHALLQTEYENFWALGGDHISAHDAHVQNLSEAAFGPSRITSFSLKALVYDPFGKERDGYQPVHITVKGAKKLSEISGKKIYDLIISEKGEALGILYHGRNQEMKLVVSEFDSLERTYGDFFKLPARKRRTP
jgi:hypothetical protein